MVTFEAGFSLCGQDHLKISTQLSQICQVLRLRVWASNHSSFFHFCINNSITFYMFVLLYMLLLEIHCTKKSMSMLQILISPSLHSPFCVDNLAIISLDITGFIIL